MTSHEGGSFRQSGGSGTSNNNNNNNNGVKFAGEESKDKMYEPKHTKKLVRVLTVVAYVFSVSLAAIMLSVYYVFLWQPRDHGLRVAAKASASANAGPATVATTVALRTDAPDANDSASTQQPTREPNACTCPPQGSEAPQPQQPPQQPAPAPAWPGDGDVERGARPTAPAERGAPVRLGPPAHADENVSKEMSTEETSEKDNPPFMEDSIKNTDSD
ncbi:hypothetical protein R5R35_009351 [Gryllus longicercus]|uniref:Transmembrane protein INAFM2 n=1 Tax=Gryllus longicercus TaxID=2509291 RepID=A0AAN9VNX3_9ORTH